jgi:SpoVK/Ycf46/Vps4 family AAA+-type ATPase
MHALTQLLKRLARFLGLAVDNNTPAFANMARKIEPRASLEDPALAESQRLILQDIVARARNSDAERGGGTVVLFTGRTGAGQGDAAEALAKDLERDLYRVDLSLVISKYIGETEKNLRRLFNAVESAGAILFFDEADALFGKRSDVKDSHDRYANIEINYLLQRLEAYKGLVILATNNSDDTPPDGFLRRFHFVVNFRRPSRP